MANALERKMDEVKWELGKRHVRILGETMFKGSLHLTQGALIGLFGIFAKREDNPAFKVTAEGFIGEVIGLVWDANTNGMSMGNDELFMNVGKASLQLLGVAGKPRAELTYGNKKNVIKVMTHSKDVQFGMGVNLGPLSLSGTRGSSTQEDDVGQDDAQIGSVDLFTQLRNNNLQCGLSWKFGTLQFSANAEGRISCLEIGTKINPVDLQVYGGVLLGKTKKVKVKGKHSSLQKGSVFKIQGESTDKGPLEIMGKASFDTNMKAKLVMGKRLENKFLPGIYQVKGVADPVAKQILLGLFFNIEM